VRANRLEAFSDGVIAIIITIMVLELHVPAQWSKPEIVKILPTLLSYGLSFLLVAIYWVNHHHLIHLAQKVDARTLWANINLLFWMSLIPWATACLSKYHEMPLVVALYGAIASACSVSFHLLRLSIACHHRRDSRLVELHRRLFRKNLVAQAIYLISIPTAWVSIPVSLALIMLPAVMYFLPDSRVELLQPGGQETT
jgi:uncharacterized membrane protein